MNRFRFSSIVLTLSILFFLGAPYAHADGLKGHYPDQSTIGASVAECDICHDFSNGHYDCTDSGCHDGIAYPPPSGPQPTPHGDPDQGVINLRWVKTSIEWPPGSSSFHTVKFTTFEGTDGSLADGDDSNLDGACEVCHTCSDDPENPMKYHCINPNPPPNGDGRTHEDGADCTTCHPHFIDNIVNYFVPAGASCDSSHGWHLAGCEPERGWTVGITSCTSDGDGCHNLAALNSGDYKTFGDDPQPLANTDVCNGCHSPDPVDGFDGVGDMDPGNQNSVDYGAKFNWALGVYEDTFDALKLDKKKWCFGCHDLGSSVVNTVSAPGVMGDNTTYGYNFTGHGNATINLNCEHCHNVTIPHTDSEQRTYSAADSSTDPDKTYRKGYRLTRDMPVPRDREVGSAAFEVCTNSDCHAYNDIVSDESNFRDDHSAEHWHVKHLEEIFVPRWDSDWNAIAGDPDNYLPEYMGGSIDSNMSCPACHNPHGSPTSAMTRHGELISPPGTTDKVPGLDFFWLKSDLTVAIDREQSRYGRLIAGPVIQPMDNHICTDCHRHDLEWIQDGNAERWYRCPKGPENILLIATWTTDDQGMVKNTFLPNDPIRYHVSFKITGCNIRPVKTPSANPPKAKSTSGTFWKTVLPLKNEHLAAGTYEWTWDSQIPGTATQPSTAKFVVTIKYVRTDGIVQKPVGTHYFNIQ